MVTSAENQTINKVQNCCSYIGIAEGGSGGSEEPPGRFKSRAKTQASASSRVCLDIHVYVYGCVQSNSDQ